MSPRGTNIHTIKLIKMTGLDAQTKDSMKRFEYSWEIIRISTTARGNICKEMYSTIDTVSLVVSVRGQSFSIELLHNKIKSNQPTLHKS